MQKDYHFAITDSRHTISKSYGAELWIYRPAATTQEALTRDREERTEEHIPKAQVILSDAHSIH